MPAGRAGRTTVSAPGVALAAMMAERNETWPEASRPVLAAGLTATLSAAVLTRKVAGASRSSSASRAGRQRAGAVRRVRGVRANQGRNQGRVVMGISFQRGVVCDTLGGQRPGRADRAPGRCRAGEGVAWRLLLTGRFACVVFPQDVCAASACQASW